jgi:hypothetical protein
MHTASEGVTVKLRVDYEEIKTAICQDVATRLSLEPKTVRLVSITRGKGPNVWAEVEIGDAKTPKAE